ncbi:hypothetical protein B0T10DRAFT_92465 [Thelonectria olida]|uniref:Uncharacterized protein n=1 Tax=Thelonectria olida TaxID=1576542 RepID=A0A9P8W2B0_9HYPO|nr:hypothetical protein B0T10DRAFT_92465 [Thelonectria olida]
MASPPPRPTGILDMPACIISFICSAFCCHCRGYQRPDITTPCLSDPWNREDEAALRALCLTSRRLRLEAQRVLFHTCVFRSRNNSITGLWKFVRTLDECEHLRPCMKVVDLPAWIPPTTRPPGHYGVVCIYDAIGASKLARRLGSTKHAGEMLEEEFVQFLLWYTPCLKTLYLPIPFH